MTSPASPAALPQPRHYPSILGGVEINLGQPQPVFHPYDRRKVGSFDAVSEESIPQVMEAATAAHPKLPRHQRHHLLNAVASLLGSRREEAACLISAESGLALQDTRHEVERALAVLQLAAVACLSEDAQVFPDDVLPGGRNRRIYTQREPYDLILAITPFNHPLNQVVHKLAPAFATNNRVILKPSQHTPLTAAWFARLCLEAGFPPEWITVVCGVDAALPRALVERPEPELITFTGGTAGGRDIAARAGTKKLVLELGGSSPLIVLPDADLETATEIAANGCFRNSGQRCTAIRRLLVAESLAEAFTERLTARAKAWKTGDPFQPENAMGTVISSDAARQIEERVGEAIHQGARLLCGQERDNALYRPTLLDQVPSRSPLVREETFGPVASILTFSSVDEAIRIANDTEYGLSSGVIGHKWDDLQRVISGVRAGSVNVNAEPGWRLEWSPFGGVKASGLGDKEGVIEAMKCMTWVKTYSLPWNQP